MAIALFSACCTTPTKDVRGEYELNNTTRNILLTVDPLIGIALVIIAALGLKGIIPMSTGGYHALLILGTFELSMSMGSLLLTFVNHMKGTYATTSGNTTDDP